jgi:hypothetical protein
MIFWAFKKWVKCDLWPVLEISRVLLGSISGSISGSKGGSKGSKCGSESVVNLKSEKGSLEGDENNSKREKNGEGFILKSNKGFIISIKLLLIYSEHGKKSRYLYYLNYYSNKRYQASYCSLKN